MASEVSPVDAVETVPISRVVPIVAQTVLPVAPVEPVSDQSNLSGDNTGLDQQLASATVAEQQASTAEAVGENAAQFQQIFDETEDVLLATLEPVPLPAEQVAVLSTGGKTKKVVVFGSLSLDVYI